MKKLILVLSCAAVLCAQVGVFPPTASPSGSAGGALTGNFPNPTLAGLTTANKVLCVSSAGVAKECDAASTLASSLTISTTMPGGAPSGSLAALGNVYAGGVKLPASASDVIGFFSGTCDASHVLGGDGSCLAVSSAFSGIATGTNTTAIMTVGSGASLAASGTGAITATGVGTLAQNLLFSGTRNIGDSAFATSPNAIYSTSIISVAQAGSFLFQNRGGMASNSDGDIHFVNNAADAGTYIHANHASIASGFGSSPSIAGTDTAMRITVGTGGVATSGVVNFGNSSWAASNPPVCVANNETTALALKATATATQVTITAPSAFGAGDKITVLCIGYY